MTVELYFLGTPHFRRDKQAVQISSAKAVALLAYLAITGRPQPRERILALLWAESAEDAARKNLRNTLWVIRREFGDDLLQSADDRLVLATDTWTDAIVFAASAAKDHHDALASAAALYGGPFLDGLNVVEAPDFELWSTTERERLGQLYLRSIAALVDEYRAQGRWDDVISAAQSALLQDNLQEPMYRALMVAHASRGDRPAALRQFETLRTILDRELGVEPLPETTQLASSISEGRLTPVTPAAVSSMPIPAAAIRDRHDPPFVGRAAELRALDAELAATDQGARVVLLSGEVGIGKSRLWQVWSAKRTAGWTTIATRCLESTQALPFVPLVQLLRSTAFQSALGPASTVPLIWQAELARLLPDLRLVHPNLAQARPLPADEERQRLFEAIVQAMLAVGPGGLVFFLDDAHWADQATLGWLGYLVDRMRGHPLLAVVAYRAEDAPGSLVRLATGWTRQGLARRLALEHLSEDESAALIAELAVDPLSAHVVQAQGNGNPYFLIELAGYHWPATNNGGSLPPALSELVRARVARLSNPARQVLQAAAVLEPHVDFAALRRASGRDEEETLDAIDELFAAGILHEDDGVPAPALVPVPSGSAAPPVNQVGSVLNFTHPLVAKVVRDDLTGARRRYLYRRAAEAIEAIHGGRLAEVAGRLANAYVNAAEPDRAARYYEMAAGHALALAALTEAAALYRQAVALAPTPERQRELGHVLSLHDTPQAARAVLDQALAGFLAQGDRLGAARTSLEVATTFLPTGRGDDVLRRAEASLAYLDTHANPEADPEAHAQAHFLLGAGRLRSGELQEAEAQLAEAARLANEKGLPGIAARSSFELGNLLAQRGDLAGAIQAYRRAIDQAQAANDPLQTILGYNNAAYHETLAGDLAAAHADIAAGVALDDALALVTPRPYLDSTRGELALAERSWDDAENWLRRALTEAARQGNQDLVAGCEAGLARVAIGRGSLDGALDFLEKAADRAASASGPYRQIQILLWQAGLFLQRGERVAADGTLSGAEGRLAGTGYGGLLSTAARLRAELGAGGRRSKL